MIDIFLNGASNKAKNGTVNATDYNYVVGGQQTISIIFLLVALACAPIMLLVKPLILKKQLEHHGEAGHMVEVHSERIEY
jgi:V-type ATPase 116kDa subunit family